MNTNSKELQKLPNNVCTPELEIHQTIYDSIPDGITVSDARTGEILHTNRVYTEITGYSKAKLEENNIYGPFDEKERCQIAQKREAAAIEETVVIADIPITTKDKKSKWIDLRSKKAICNDRLVNIDFYTDVTKRVSIKEAANTITDELNKAQEIGNIGSWVWNVITGEVKPSDHFFTIWGLPVQSATYEFLLAGIHPDDISIVEESLDKTFKKEKDYDVTFRVLHKNGNIRVVNSIGEVEFNEADQPAYMRGTVKDITEVYYIDQENKRLKSLFDNSSDFIAFASLEGKVEFVNKSGRTMVGLDPSEDLSTKTIADFLTEEGLEASQKHEVPAVQKNGHWSGESTLRHMKSKNAMPVMINSFLIYNDLMEPIGLGTIQRDITDQKLVMKQLMKWQHLFDYATWGIAIGHIASDTFDVVNDAFAKIHGYSKEEMTHMPIQKSFTPESLAKMPAIFEVMKKEGHCEFEAVRLRKDGTEFPVLIELSFIKDENNNILYRAAHIQDITQRKIEEKELAKSTRVQTILDKAAEISHTGTWELDLVTSELIWSDVTKKIHEVPLGYVPALDTAINYYAEGYSKDKITEAVSRAIEFGEQYDLELQVISAKGNLRHVRAIGLPEKENGKVVRLLGVFQDQTNQKRSETALKASEKKYKELINLAQEGIWVIDENSFTSFVNPSMAKMLGYSIEEMKGKRLFDFMDDRGVEISKHNMERREKGITEQHDFEFRSKNGDKVIVVLETAPIIDDEGRFKGAIAGAVDITARKKMEELLRENEAELERKVFDRTSELGLANEELSRAANKLRKAYHRSYESEKKYRFLAENSHDVVVAYDAELKVTYVSPAIESLTGYTVEETIEIKGVDMIHPKDLPSMLDLFNKAISTRANDQILRYRRRLKKGGYLWVETAVSFIYDDKDNFLSMIINVRDISSQIQAEESLKSTQSQLIQSDKMASLGVLTAGIAHEINNPVNFVYAGINSLEDNLIDVKKVLSAYEEIDLNNVAVKLPKVQKVKHELQYDKLMNFVDRSTGNIKKGAERTSEIIKGLKTFSRIDSDKVISSDIHESLDNTLLLLRNQYKDNIGIHKKYGKIPLIECYPGKLNQVFVNVIANAIQSINKQGTIIISTRALQKNKLGFIEIAIADNGKGMDKKMQTRIFEPFFTTKDVGQGTGLGLSISHGIIENHKGFIEVESKENVGTTFKIYLPVDRAS